MNRTGAMALAAVAVTTTMFSCGIAQLQGNGVSRAGLRSADGFDDIIVGDGIEATVTPGDRTEVWVDGDENLLAYVDTRLEGTTLIVEARDGYQLVPTQPIHLTVVATRAVAVHAGGSAGRNDGAPPPLEVPQVDTRANWWTYARGGW